MTKQSISFYKEIEATIKNIISKRIPMHHIPNNQLRISTLQSRREALKQLRDLGILGIGGLLGLQHLAKQDNLALQFSQDSISNLANVDTITDSIFHSNISKAILSLSLSYFSIPHEYAHILQFHKDKKDLNLIIPLTTNKYLDYTHYYLDMPMPHKNLPFLSYHYDSLQSFLKDIESLGFYLRDYTMDSINTQIIKEYFMLLETKEQIQTFYQEYKERESRAIEAIYSYHSAMNYLDDIYQGSFNTNLNDTALDPLKHRNFLKALDIIGQNNIKALYVGVNKEVKEQEVLGDLTDEDMGDNSTDKIQQESRPKLVGRLATTIIMKNGLHLG